MVTQWVRSTPAVEMQASSPPLSPRDNFLILPPPLWGLVFLKLYPLWCDWIVEILIQHAEILSDTNECYIHLAQCRVGRTARLGERGDSLLFLQPVEIDYLQDLERHGVLLTEYPLLKLLDSLPLYGHNQHVKKFISLEMHPWVLSLQKALESFIYREVSFV